MTLPGPPRSNPDASKALATIRPSTPSKPSKPTKPSKPSKTSKAAVAAKVAGMRSTRSARAARVLDAATWAVILAGGLVGFSLRAPEHSEAFQAAVMIVLALFFPLIVGRLVLAAVVHRLRRPSLVALGVGIAFWAAGSAQLQSVGPTTTASLFTPGELCFIAGYVGFAVFLVLDAPRRGNRALATWLDTTVMCAGTASLAALALVTPVGLHLGGHGLQLFLALLDPLIDVVLAIVVVGQLASHQRRLGLRTGTLTLGLALLAIADVTYVLNLSSTTYVGSAAIDAIYGVSFALVVMSACSTPTWLETSRPPNQRARILLAAAALAVCILVLQPTGEMRWYVVPPAVLTLAAAGGRLTLALKQSQGAAEALRLSRTDELTGLGNRRAVLAAVDAGLALDAPLALMLLDLDGFKDINDSLGHAAGDGVLTTVAARLNETVSPHATVGRLGGDEFAIVVPDNDPVRLTGIAQQVRETLFRPVRVDNLEVAIRASIGITVRQDSDEKATDMLRRADVAMYEAKGSRSGALLYDAARDSFSRQRLLLAEDLRRGIDAGQLVVWYQPQIDARTGKVVAAEALVRWDHPEEGLLPPVHFLPDARRFGLMLALTDAVMRQVIQDARRWADEGFDFRVSLNCAPPELLGGALLPRLFDAIDTAGLAPNSLMVEVTEDSFVTDPEHARKTLYDLRAHHVQTAIDDYGTGFSSLAYLRDLPVQELKMDRSFIATINTDPRSRVIVDSTNQMARAMGLRLVAEGVEDAETAAELSRMGVDVLQGYHIARPMPSTAFAAWVRRWSATRAGQVEELSVW